MGSEATTLGAMKATVVYESLTGNTALAGQIIARELTAAGIETVACSITEVNLQSLSESDLVVVGSWTDGLFFFGQKPGRGARLATLPVIDGKKAAVYCTYAINAGKTLTKLSRIVGLRGGDVIGGFAIKRSRIEEDASEFVDRLLAQVDTASA